VDFADTWTAMREFTETRTDASADQFWCLEHPRVFTLGRAGREEHLLAPADIPVVHTDRGGQVTYHGPGQLVVYTMVDIRRAGLGIRQLVTCLERSVVELLASHGIAAAARPEAPGVYVDGEKIAALGLRIHRGCSYHGLSLNVGMDLEPFGRINPCGFAGLAVTQLSAHGVRTTPRELCGELMAKLYAQLYSQPSATRAETAPGAQTHASCSANASSAAREAR
jgi:lipoyl(octanoyl) transferase